MRKILLIICVAFVVLCYGYPCFILPFGEYSKTYELAGVSVEETYKFNFNGTCVHSLGELTTEYHYKLSGNDVILSINDTFDDEDDFTISINSMYNVGNGFFNQVGMYVAIGVGVAALLLIVTIPRKN